jgi:hypothetical protein
MYITVLMGLFTVPGTASPGATGYDKNTVLSEWWALRVVGLY